MTSCLSLSFFSPENPEREYPDSTEQGRTGQRHLVSVNHGNIQTPREGEREGERDWGRREDRSLLWFVLCGGLIIGDFVSIRTSDILFKDCDYLRAYRAGKREPHKYSPNSHIIPLLEKIFSMIGKQFIFLKKSQPPNNETTPSPSAAFPDP